MPQPDSPKHNSTRGTDMPKKVHRDRIQPEPETFDRDVSWLSHRAA